MFNVTVQSGTAGQDVMSHTEGWSSGGVGWGWGWGVTTDTFSLVGIQLEAETLNI